MTALVADLPIRFRADQHLDGFWVWKRLCCHYGQGAAQPVVLRSTMRIDMDGVVVTSSTSALRHVDVVADG